MFLLEVADEDDLASVSAIHSPHDPDLSKANHLVSAHSFFSSGHVL